MAAGLEWLCCCAEFMYITGKNMINKGRLITIEGVEGVGKSTALLFIETQLKKANIDFVLTREPGGTKIAEAIRKVLLHHEDENMLPETELFLMFAARVQHIAEVVKPALLAGKWVISDRFIDASFAYQGGGRGISMERIEVLADWVQGDCQPDLTLLLDAPVSVGLARMMQRGAKDRIEKETTAFFERVRSVYLKRAQLMPDRFAVIKADQKLPQVQAQITSVINHFIEKHQSTVDV